MGRLTHDNSGPDVPDVNSFSDGRDSAVAKGEQSIDPRLRLMAAASAVVQGADSGKRQVSSGTEKNFFHGLLRPRPV